MDFSKLLHQGEKILLTLRAGVVYSVENMSITQWAILGTTSVVLGFMLLKSNRI